MKAGIEKISRSAVIWQLLAFAAVVIPHVGWLPVWVMVICAVCVAARLMIHSGRWSFPHWSLRLVLVIGAAAGLLLSFNRDASLNAMAALLIIGLALKLLEIYRRRDALVLLYVALFVAATTFLFEQGMAMALVILLTVVVVVAALNSIWQDPLREDMRRPLKLSVKMLGPALPLMLVLFFLFPRIGPLWSVELDRSAARTGLSESMSPGDISQLTRSGELAFRAVFADQPPPASLRYWRVLVLSAFDGREWTPGRFRAVEREPLIALAEPISYEIVQEPSGRRWQFALDMPTSPPPQAEMTAQRTLLASSEVMQRVQYPLSSVPAYQLSPQLSSEAHDYYTRLPRQANPRSRDLAEQWWQASNADTAAFIDQLFGYFNASFIYTLEPAALGRHSVDDFLFETQQGFCEHFASAAAFMLRAAGMPARVVTGYQGGEWNANQNYLTLRQYDAHAWVEVWLDNQGWVRLDPTAAVAPERIEQSADQLFSGQAGFLADSPLSALRLARQGWLLQARMYYDSLNFAWQRWVLNYHDQQQNVLQDWLGELTPLKMALALLLPGALIISWLAWRLLRSKTRMDPLQKRLQILLKTLANRGFQRQPEETLSGLVTRIAQADPLLAEQLRPVAEAYAALRYQSVNEVKARRQVMICLDMAQKYVNRYKRAYK
ncbi:transglutaminase TgpA family protein [Nitrincola iocasae]|uniref:DUF3488 domain-containing protein n=1 Tax=Nitrincola iocasae TaxID=2614693 RepID=A0A5J6LC65_9GAMM|nr:DUF3488 and transglutaminase-like domain-containing protein [Nitrincola iocasae]QEW05996.1 DUF3488 domain-containing protein [Nitrincola iocasae]